MGGNLDFRELFLSGDGRIARTPFWLGAIVILVLLLLYESINSPTLHWVTGLFIYPLLIYPGVCVLSKRLHDRGRSGWWAALILFATVAVWPHPSSFFDFLFMVILIWAVVELGVMPGEAGANRYGPNPMRGAAAA